MASVAAGWRGVLATLLWLAVRTLRPRRAIEALTDREVDDLAALLVIGLGASRTLAGALEESSLQLGEPVRSEVDDLLRRARLKGLASALAETAGPLSPLAAQLTRAQLSGAPMVDAVSAFLQTRRSVVRAGLLESARTLPVRLIVPVTLLLLPGFVLLLMGPFVVEQIGQLVGSSIP